MAIHLAEHLSVSWRTIYRYRDRLREADEALAVLGHKRGWKPAASRLSAEQEQAIADAVRRLRKKPGPVRVIDLVEEVAVRCRLLKVPCPSRPAIDRRLKRSAGVKVHRRGVAPPGNADPRISPGSFVVQRPLDVVQMDHTPMDIVVIDDLYRQPLGKPYLTLATDVATRCIVGFVISFVPPGAATVSLCLTLVVSPKTDWLRQIGITGEWPMAGLPKSLHLDGAAEFKSKALLRGCAQYGIDLVHRERPHHGGHIERVIGTKMSKLKALPGATGGSPKARRSYDPDKHAALTLGELEAWFAQQIVGRYHHEAHRGLKGSTPAAAWALAPAPRLPAGSLKRFRIAFLPAITRTLRRSGIVFEHLRYWHPIFAQWLNQHESLTLHFASSGSVTAVRGARRRFPRCRVGRPPHSVGEFVGSAGRNTSFARRGSPSDQPAHAHRGHRCPARDRASRPGQHPQDAPQEASRCTKDLCRHRPVESGTSDDIRVRHRLEQAACALRGRGLASSSIAA